MTFTMDYDLCRLLASKWQRVASKQPYSGAISLGVLYLNKLDLYIYGATFIDYNNKCVLNGSRLGKEFSANVFNERFGGTQNIGTDIVTVLSIPQNSHCQGQPKAAQDQSAESPKLNIMGAVGGLFSGVSPDGGDDDYNKLIKKKKKKKRRHGRQMY